MGELSKSLLKTITITIAGQDYECSKITMGIYAQVEREAEKDSITPVDSMDVKERAMLPFNFLQTNRGRMFLLTTCINKIRTPVQYINIDDFADSLDLSNMPEIIEAVTKLMTEDNAVSLPGEDDDQGNAGGTGGASA